jgi:type II secretory ATPase GspE/PulE/Tfp pilus assembly ATPase PilB-like protein
MRTLRESGILSILEGRTTIEEVMRETLSLEL